MRSQNGSVFGGHFWDHFFAHFLHIFRARCRFCSGRALPSCQVEAFLHWAKLARSWKPEGTVRVLKTVLFINMDETSMKLNHGRSKGLLTSRRPSSYQLGCPQSDSLACVANQQGRPYVKLNMKVFLYMRLYHTSSNLRGKIHEALFWASLWSLKLDLKLALDYSNFRILRPTSCLVLLTLRLHFETLWPWRFPI